MNKKNIFLGLVGLTVLTFVVFSPVLFNDFIHYDDNIYITENDHVQSGFHPENILWAFSSITGGNWHPLTWLSHILDWQLFGAWAGGHHLVSLLFHIGAVIFLFLFLLKTTHELWPSAFAAAFFALHPLRVESVAWASERKDVLSMFFGMASLYAYAFYAENKKTSRYLLCLFLFILSLMAKPMLVTLPFVFLLVDVWPLKRWHDDGAMSFTKNFQVMMKLVKEKWFFFFLTVVICIITFIAQQRDESTSFGNTVPLTIRMVNAVHSYILYLGKILWPLNLTVFYPYRQVFPWAPTTAFCVLMVLISVAALFFFKKRSFLFVGWFWYVGTLIPVIGLVQVGEQSMADRYTYFPFIGIAIILAYGLFYFFHNAQGRRIIFVSGLWILVLMSSIAWKQCGYWRSTESLFNHAIRIHPDNYVAHNNWGYALMEKGEFKKAFYHFQQALAAQKNYPTAYMNRGKIFAYLEHDQRAIVDYNEAIRLNPDYADAYIHRGIFYQRKGLLNRAANDFLAAVRIRPDLAIAYYNLGVVYEQMGDQRIALEAYDKAIGLNSRLTDAFYNRGTIFGRQKKYQQAVEDFSRVIYLKPEFANAYNNRGFTFLRMGLYRQALEDFNRAVALKNDDPRYVANRAWAYLKINAERSACLDARQACALKQCDTLRSFQSAGFCRRGGS